MYIHPVLCVCTVSDLDANDSHLRLCLMGANGVLVSVSKGFLCIGFQSRSINAYLIPSPYVLYTFPLSIP